MFSRRILLVLALSGVALPACQQEAQKAGALTDADRKAMEARVADFDKAVRAADWPAVVSFYAEDGMLLPPNAPVVQGRQAMQRFFEEWPKITEFKESVTEIEGYGDLASMRGTYEMTMTPPGATAPLKDTGKSLAVWRKQPDGSWLVSRVSWNSDLAPVR
jgi:uncharacterized protein (TIGR02246 family)